MQSIWKFCLAFAIALALTPKARASNRLIAVLPLDTTNSEGKLSKAGQTSLEEDLRDVAANVLSPAGWTVMTGETTLQVMKDNGIDASKCGDTECNLSSAREISAEKFVSGSVQWADDELVASIRIIDTKTGAVLSAEMLEGVNAKDLRKEFEAKATGFFTRGGLIAGVPLASASAKPPPAPVPTPTPSSAVAPSSKPAPNVVASNRVPPLGMQPQPTPGAVAPDQNALWNTTPGALRFESRSGLNFVWMPGGTFSFGCESRNPADCGSAPPARPETVSGFWMARSETPMSSYERCVHAGKCPDTRHNAPNCTQLNQGKHPVNCVTWDQAKAFCEWIGGRLPTPSEWEYAAKSGGNSWYPWGNEPVTATRANYCDKNCPDALNRADQMKWRKNRWIDPSTDDGAAGASPVGKYPDGRTKWGLYNMAGNVWEWVGPHAKGSDAPAFGGSYLEHPSQLRTWLEQKLPKNSAKAVVGFRCRL